MTSPGCGLRNRDTRACPVPLESGHALTFLEWRISFSESGCPPSVGYALVACQFCETFHISRLRHLRGPGCEIGTSDGGRNTRRVAEETASFSRREAGKPRRLEIGGGAIGGLDHRKEVCGQRQRQAEAHVDRGKQASLHCFVGVADHGFERRDDVANHVFWRIVQQYGETAFAVESHTLMSDRLDQERVLCD